MLGLLDFIFESNRIEGIVRTPTKAEVLAHSDFLANPRIATGDLERFVDTVAGAPMRRVLGQDVYVGRHRPPRGGPHVEAELAAIIADANDDKPPYAVHIAYEALHPFMDGNGRSGRVLWAWMMRRQARDPFALGFLHRWYYDSLDAERLRISSSG